MSLLAKLSDEAADDDEKEAIERTRAELYGAVSVDDLPSELSDEFLRQQAGVPHHLWSNARLYPAKTKGKLRAAQIVKNQMETITRVHEIMKRNRKSLEGSKPKPKLKR